MIPRDLIDIYLPNIVPNGSGGQKVDTATPGELIVSAQAEVTILKPTREQLAEQTRLGESLKVRMWARDVTITADHVLYWNSKRYSIQGPPQPEGQIRVLWTLYAKTQSA